MASRATLNLDRDTQFDLGSILHSHSSSRRRSAGTNKHCVYNVVGGGSRSLTKRRGNSASAAAGSCSIASKPLHHARHQRQIHHQIQNRDRQHDQDSGSKGHAQGHTMAGATPLVSTLSSTSPSSHRSWGASFSNNCDVAFAPLPLPPAVSRMFLEGSPFSPCSSPHSTEASPSYHRLGHLYQRGTGLGNPGASVRSSGGGSGGGGGGPGTESGDMSPGGGDISDETPSSYTFRRRNAIVEGSEDAPKPVEAPAPPE